MAMNGGIDVKLRPAIGVAKQFPAERHCMTGMLAPLTGTFGCAGFLNIWASLIEARVLDVRN